MDTPLVSIIIPTFNRVNLICDTLDSILAQTYTNWECIVVDDGSTDGTEGLLANYIAKDGRFQYFKRPDSHLPGGNGARNYGYQLSKGDYINWFDSDDLMYKKKLEIQIALLHQTNFDFTICQSMMFNFENGKELGFRAKRIVSKHIFQDYVAFKIFWLTQAPLWKRSFLEAFNLKFDEKLKQSQDYDFHIRVLAVSENYSFTNEPLVKVGCHNENMSNTLVESEAKLKSNLYVKSEIFDSYEERINLETKRIVFMHIFELYRHVVYTRSLKKVSIVFSTLVKHIPDIELPFSKQIALVAKLICVTILYLIFKKGYSYINIKI